MLHLLALWLSLCSLSAAREVHVEVFAPWEQQVILPVHEVGEFLASTNNAIFFDYIDQLCTQSARIDQLLQNIEHVGQARVELQQLAYSVAKPLLSADLHHLMESMVDSGYYAPAAAFQASLVSPSVQDSSSCSPAIQALNTLTASITCDPFDATNDWEHVYPLEQFSSSSASFVLSGPLGSQGFCSAFTASKGLVASGDASHFAVRPTAFNLTKSAEKISLAGYGVFLDIKNMEYKNVDDSPAAASTNTDASSSSDKDSISADFEVAGVNLHMLQASHQDEVAQEELLILKDRLLTIEKAQSVDEQSPEQEMKVWRMKDLGLQAAQRVHSRYVKGDNPLSEWATLSHNFPRYASQLSSSKVSIALQNDVQSWYSSQAAQQLPSNSLYINGMRVELGDQSFNFFDLLFKIQEELKLQHSLDSLALSGKTKEKIFDVAKRVGEEDTDDSSDSSSSTAGPELEAITKGIRRIDMSKGGKFAVMFLNNLEKDVMYKQMGWPKTLRTLLYPSWSLHTLARNLYTFIAIVDVFSESGAGLLTQMNMLYQQQYPLRFGAVFACDKSPLHTDFCRIFAAIKEEYSLEQAFQFAFHLAGTVAEGVETSFNREALLALASATITNTASGGEDDSSMFGSLFGSDKKRLPANSDKIGEGLATMLATEDKYMDFVRNTTTYLSQRNVPLNSYSLNGIVSLDPTISQAFMQTISREQYIFSTLVRQGKLSEKSKSIFADVMKLFGGLSRYHVMLDETQPKYIQAWKLSDADWQENFLTFTSSSAVTAEDNTIALTSDEPQHVVLAVPASREGMAAVMNTLSYAVTAGGNLTTVVDLILLPVAVSQEQDVEVSADGPASSSSPSITAKTNARLLHLLSRTHRILALSMNSKTGGVCDKTCIAAYQQILQLLIGADADNMDSVLGMLKGMIPGLTLDDAAGTSNEQGNNRIVAKLTDDKNAAAFLALNGRVLSPSPIDVQASDLDLLFDLEAKRIGRSVVKVGLLRDIAKGRNTIAAVRLTGVISSFLGHYNAAGGKRIDVTNILRVGVFEPFSTDLSTLMTPLGGTGVLDEDDFTTDPLEIYCIVDPLSLAGQRGAALVDFLVNHLSYRVTLLMTPRTEISEFPLQNFYRFVLPVSNGGTEEEGVDAASIVGPRAVFDHLPRQHTLTTRIDVPEPWNVQTAYAIQDTDNLRCTATACGDVAGSSKELTELGYVLKSLLVAGQCLQTTVSDRDLNRYGLPPNGLQLMLYTPSLEVQADTLVMQNLGYYQLQVPRPGAFLLGLAPGRATQLFTLRDTTRLVSLPDGVVEHVQEITVRSFRDEVRRLVVVKRPGMEAASLLEDQDGEDEEMLRQQQESIWSRMTRTLSTTTTTSSKPKKTVEDEDKTIHVFSLATGHLYERLLRIMMLSVSRRTSQPVKFWLFENYLSPSFKALAALMAEHYGFEIGYVTYKWPAWLRQQTQQQRIIWGYKVLFLDVLFPLNVKKVIYVDADQVLRADLKELWDMDLQGHAYAYTPFCTSRQETLGFQFWRQGYWKDHLQGRPYHISALYVVDLQRFRRRAVGDQLRAVYDNLSRDPNSLANLDQDLPNYAQHAVPIFSLPQEWLWCETWCSDDSKAKAKTIDLCNNPLHKEPKMDMARRVISGSLFNESWVQLDEEIRALGSVSGH